MPKPGYIDVDALQAETSLEEAAAKCGVTFDGKESGKEIRIDCPFNCPGDHSGRREVSVSTESPQKVFFCHAYQCQVRGNLLTLMHGWLTGVKPTGGKLKGAEFNRIKQILAENSSHPTTTAPTHAAVAPPPKTSAPATPSVPLEEHDDENIRALATLHEKLIQDVAQMSPSAASYVRRHPVLSPESMQKWQVGYLPMDGGGDKRGWSLRGHILYPIRREDGKILAWIGRDPAYEEKEQNFLSLSPDARATKKPPQKHKVPSGFARGMHLFGQHASRLREPGYREFINQHGLVIVEGFNDVIGLDNLRIPALGLCSNRMTDEQAEKIERFARQIAEGKVTLLFDCDEAGDAGAKEALWLLTQRHLQVRLGWTQRMHAASYSGFQPEQLSETHVRDLLS